jgi:hypothetical protein
MVEGAPTAGTKGAAPGTISEKDSKVLGLRIITK